jgi:zinc transport system substrate-binding protein
MSLAFYCMKIGYNRFVPLLAACVVLSLGCGRLVAARVDVWVSIQPQKFFVERIGGDSVSVEVLVRPGQSPELYAPGVAQIAKLARANLFFGIGMPVEASLFQRMASSMKAVRIVQTGLTPSGDHTHCHEGHHDHSENDPHIWLDPVQMIAAVGIIRDALIAAEPEQAALFWQNAEALVAELTSLDAALMQQLAAYAGRVFYINHPALGHFAKRYGLVQASIEQAGTSPSARRIAELVREAREAKVGAIFTQPEFGRTSATVLARALNVEVIEIDLLSADYITNMYKITDSLAGSFEK